MKEARLETMSDREVVARLEELLRAERRLTAAVLAHLGEVEARRLFLPAACSSMHVYCVRVLGMSEDQAFKRIRAARAMRRFSIVGAAVAEGRLHLTGVVLLAPHLTDENAAELVAEASGKTRAEIEILLARRAPRAMYRSGSSELRSRPRWWSGQWVRWPRSQWVWWPRNHLLAERRRWRRYQPRSSRSS
jgi:hypothetical protein